MTDAVTAGYICICTYSGTDHHDNQDFETEMCHGAITKDRKFKWHKLQNENTEKDDIQGQ